MLCWVELQYETQIADNADQLSTAAATHAELETSLAQLQQQFEKETATFEKDKASLNKMIEVAQKVGICCRMDCIGAG